MTVYVNGIEQKSLLEDIKSSKGFAIVEDEKYGLVVKAPSGVKYQITPKEDSDKEGDR